MATTIQARIQPSKSGLVLKAANAIDDHLLSKGKYAIGELITLKITKARSVRQNAFYWALLSDYINHLPESLSQRIFRPEDLHEAIKHELGLTEVTYDLRGNPIVKTLSWSFDGDLDGKDANEYLERALDLLTKLTGIDPETMRENAA